ncbi:hypothetical protein [Parasitella parasitica]|uniref:LAG1-DNAbind-domain-containing protein n=1 Tax=Parasitella parasitica TaxID=35722 RepID=A0A0B7NSC1_9FUNG|nr:hypothetical protein [Parasitella parasitica]
MSDTSANSNVFYANAIHDSPESPTSRKRKQEELQYPSHSASHHFELSSYYAPNQHEQQPWHQQIPPSPHHHQEQQMQAATSDASSLVINFSNQANMQASSDISSWSHHHPLPHHSISTLMQPDFSMADPQQTSAYVAAGSYMDSPHSELRGTSDKTGGVGENHSLSEIHQMLNLDQFSTASTLAETPTPTSYSFIEEPAALRLDDLSAANLQQQSQLIQSWSNSAGRTTNAQQSSNYSNNGSGTPGFFTPGFLGSLQEDDSESYHTSDLNFHRPTHSSSSEWNPSCSSPHQIEHDPFLVSEMSLLKNNSMASSSEQSATVFHQSHPSTPTSPIPSQHLLNAKQQQQQQQQQQDAYTEQERTVIILSSKVAQKSYGTEKRFLCPPPTAMLLGKSWWTIPLQRFDTSDSNEVLKMPNGHELCPPRISVSISGETAAQACQIEWYTVSGVTVGQTGHVKPLQTASPSTSTTSTSTGSTTEQPQQQKQQHSSRFRSSVESRSSSIDWYQNHAQETLAAGKCVSKHLFINDADEKRKRVAGLIRIQLANGTHMGALASKSIKVISKPSKKRQSVKNMELCIHHGTTVSLFNRIRSQTVSTKYLGVSSSSPFSFPGQPFRGGTPGDGTCFVARTTCWDPFIIWVVDTNRSTSNVKESEIPEDYIGRNAFTRNIPYPPPPGIALKNKTNQLVPIHYNQHIVLQCLTTGLVSPVMIIRKVDKASMVVGGVQAIGDDLGGEYGDEVLGDPVSQLHKIALQIVQDPQQQKQHLASEAAPLSNTMLPRSCDPITYLACLNDMVGTHKTTDTRRPIVPAVKTPKPNSNLGQHWDDVDALFNITSQEAGGKIVRKQRVSIEPSLPMEGGHDIMNDPRRRVNSLSDDYLFYSNNISPSVSFPGVSRPQHHHHHGISRKSSISSNSSTGIGFSGGGGAGGGGGRRPSTQNQTVNGLGAYWQEDVSDVAVWTIVGTDCATYTFLPPSKDMIDDSSTAKASHKANATNDTPFPIVNQMTTKASLENKDQLLMSLHGEHFSRDLQVWFGDIKASSVEYKSRELIVCRMPSKNELLPTKHTYDQIPILLVRGDGTVCKTNKAYPV